MGGAIDKQTMLGLIIDAKRTDSETGSFAEWLAEYLAEHMPTLTPPNEWRGVEEGLPEIYLDEEGNNIPFLVCGPDSKYPFRALFIGNSWFNGWDPVEVTHWMPLPAQPNRRPSEVAP